MDNAFARRYGGSCTYPNCGVVRDYHRHVVGHAYTREVPGRQIVAARSFDAHPQRSRDLAAEREVSISAIRPSRRIFPHTPTTKGL